MEAFTPDEHPLHCPKCRSPHVTYTKDASLAFTQNLLGTEVVRDAGTASEFDNVLDAQCLECHFAEAEPASAWWE
jgi:hypothetical protein